MHSVFLIVAVRVIGHFILCCFSHSCSVEPLNTTTIAEQAEEDTEYKNLRQYPWSVKKNTIPCDTNTHEVLMYYYVVVCVAKTLLQAYTIT